MKLSTKGRYAVMAICDLAKHSDGRPVSLAEIADRQDISLSYLEQLFAKLRRAGVVKSVRGPGGGYLPAHPLAEITVAAVVQAVEEVENPPARSAAGQGLTTDLWDQLGNQVRWFLNRVSIADVIGGRVPGAVGSAANEDPSAQPIAAD